MAYLRSPGGNSQPRRRFDPLDEKPSHLPCHTCGKDIPQHNGPGRARRFCSEACRSKDYSQRYYEKTGGMRRRSCRHTAVNEEICAECVLKEKVRFWLKNHGLSIEDGVRLLIAQDGRCAICRVPIWYGRGEGNAAIDHDHACCPYVTKSSSCGKCVRGLLCQSCNQGLGHFDDDVDKVINAGIYLERYARKV